MKLVESYEKQLLKSAVMIDTALSEPDLSLGLFEQLNLTVVRMLLAHALSEFGLTPKMSLTNLLSERSSHPGESYSRFIQMFKTRDHSSSRTQAQDNSWNYEECLSISPLSLGPTEAFPKRLLTDGQMLELAAAIDGIGLVGPKAKDPIDRSTVLGNLYELIRDRNSRREGGIFYTPNWVASAICDLALDAYQSTWQQTDDDIRAESLRRLLDLRILDNACGCGVFLVTMLHKMVDLILTAAGETPESTHGLKAQGMNLTERSSIARHIIMHSLHGRDLDRTALKIASTQLWLASWLMDSDLSPRPLPAANLLNMDSLLQNMQRENGFDVIVGNPPYMKASSLPESTKTQLRERYPVRGEYNSHALFVYSALRQLKRDGVLAYLVHKNILTLDSYSDLRRLLLESYQCVNLIDCGPSVFKSVTAETGIIVVRNMRPLPDTSVGLSGYARPTSIELPMTSISQIDYLRLVRPWKYRYLLNVREEDMLLLHLLEELPRLGGFVTITRGIETGHNRQSLSSIPKEHGNWVPVLRGRDISAFKGTQRFFLDYSRDVLSKPGPSDLRGRPKLVVQQNSRSPIAFFDEGRFLVLNSATYISEAAPDFLKSVCVLLNSRLVGWFFRKVITNDARLTVNILPNNLGLIPLPAHIDRQNFAWLCDALTALYADSEQSYVWETETLRNLADAAVLESYFPHLFPEKHATRALAAATIRPMTSQELIPGGKALTLSAVAAQKTLDSPFVEEIARLSI